MIWQESEVRRVKLTFTHPLKKVHDLSITFGVDGKQKDEFYVLLQDYIKFIGTNDGTVKDVDEVLDSETQEACDLHIFIQGLNQKMFVQELQNRAEAFIDASQWQI